LHKPVITAEGAPPEPEIVPNYIYALDWDSPSSPGQEAAYEAAEISLTSDLEEAVEDAHQRTEAVNDAFESKNYAEAARLQETIAAAVRRTETGAEGNPGDATLDALLSLSWYQLAAGQYDAVIATADQAAAIREDYISIDANRAHALMLKGAADEARFIYSKHKGKETRNKKTWDNEVLDDFAELEQADIRHPLMDEIRSAWAVKPLTWKVV
jgi:tetratricopeptide (TPR) repeat protein